MLPSASTTRPRIDDEAAAGLDAEVDMVRS